MPRYKDILVLLLPTDGQTSGQQDWAKDLYSLYTWCARGNAFHL